MVSIVALEETEFKSTISGLFWQTWIELSNDTMELFTELYAKWTTQKISEPIKLKWLVCFFSDEFIEKENFPKSILWWWNTFAVVIVRYPNKTMYAEKFDILFLSFITWQRLNYLLSLSR